MIDLVIDLIKIRILCVIELLWYFSEFIFFTKYNYLNHFITPMVFSPLVDWDEKIVAIGSYMIPTVITLIEDVIGDVGGGRTIDVSIVVVTVVVSTEWIPSSMLRFVSLFDKSTVMSGVSTSSILDSACETSNGLRIVFSWNISGLLNARIDVCMSIRYVYIDIKITYLLEIRFDRRIPSRWVMIWILDSNIRLFTVIALLRFDCQIIN